MEPDLWLFELGPFSQTLGPLLETLLTIDLVFGEFGRPFGLPVRRIIVATNANDEVPEFLRTGRYRKIAPSRLCISNAMNVGHPSNLARLVDVYGGWLDETGTLRKAPDLDRMREDLYAVSISDDQTRLTIKDVYERFGKLLEPHGAVGWAGMEQYFRDHPEQRDRLTVCIETAHPAKFPDEIRAIVGVDPAAPASIADLDERQEDYGRISSDYAALRDWLLSRFR